MDHMIQLYHYLYCCSSVAVAAVEGLTSVIEVLPKFLTPYISDIIIQVVVMIIYCLLDHVVVTRDVIQWLPMVTMLR